MVFPPSPTDCQNDKADPLAAALPMLARTAATSATFRLPFLDGALLLGGADTANAFALLEMRLRPGRGPDPHIHLDEDEYFYVLEGDYRIRCGDEVLDCRPGQLVKVDRGVPHGLTAGSRGGRHLTMFVPAGPEGWFVEAAALAEQGELDPAALTDLFERYGMRRLDPGRTGMFAADPPTRD